MNEHSWQGSKIQKESKTKFLISPRLGGKESCAGLF